MMTEILALQELAGDEREAAATFRPLVPQSHEPPAGAA
jgi:hypothetical protein